MKIIILVTATAIASGGVLNVAEAAQHSKAHRAHRPHHHVAQTAGDHKDGVSYGNNTRDNSYGGVYGEYSFKGD